MSTDIKKKVVRAPGAVPPSADVLSHFSVCNTKLQLLSGQPVPEPVASPEMKSLISIGSQTDGTGSAMSRNTTLSTIWVLLQSRHKQEKHSDTLYYKYLQVKCNLPKQFGLQMQNEEDTLWCFDDESFFVTIKKPIMELQFESSWSQGPCKGWHVQSKHGD